MITKNSIPQNEIDPILKTINEYKVLIFIITLLGLGLAALSLFNVAKPTYEATILIQIGKKNNKFVEPIEALEIKLLDKYQISTNKAMPRISRIRVYNKSLGILRLHALAHDPKLLPTYLKNQVSLIFEEHNLSVIPYMKEVHDKLTLALNNDKETRITLNEIKKTIKKNTLILDKLTNTEQALINLHMIRMLNDNMFRENTYDRLVSYNRLIRKYEKMLLDTRTFDSYIINEVNIYPPTVAESKSIILAAGLVSGFLLSLLLVFFLSFWSKRKV